MTFLGIRTGIGYVLAVVLAFLAFSEAPAAGAAQAKAKKPAAASTKKALPASKKASPAKKNAPVKKVATKRRRRRSKPRWLVPTFVDSNGVDDVTEGDDPAVRDAAVQALGTHNGAVIVVDPTSGRILSAVNQGVVFARGFQPCSTFKPIVGLGALAEGVITRETNIKVARRQQMNLTEALAVSNNNYFQVVGMRLGFEKLHSYASLFGIGERATLNVERELPGSLTPAPPANGGIGFMSSHGEGIQYTPVQLAAVMTALANGGRLYYLQYPRTPFEAATMEPRLKRQLAIGDWIPEIKPGMMGATEFGTARRAAYSADEPILGKTGTCTDRSSPTHLGWFASFNEAPGGAARKLVVVVLLTGGAGVGGSQAAAIGGDIYRRLSEARYFASAGGDISTAGSVLALAGE